MELSYQTDINNHALLYDKSHIFFSSMIKISLSFSLIKLFCSEWLQNFYSNSYIKRFASMKWKLFYVNQILSQHFIELWLKITWKTSWTFPPHFCLIEVLMLSFLWKLILVFNHEEKLVFAVFFLVLNLHSSFSIRFSGM